tara:strand:- start:1337 stop:1642 length:306 start_codon:yes stop_codon:yes gene_type:complete
MTVKNIIEQVEKIFGRQSEQYMYQLINDALDDISTSRGNYSVSSTSNLEGYKRWYELPDKVISIKKVEILDTNDRYIMIPKLADSHKLLREDTESSDDSLK